MLRAHTRAVVALELLRTGVRVVVASPVREIIEAELDPFELGQLEVQFVSMSAEGWMWAMWLGRREGRAA